MATISLSSSSLLSPSLSLKLIPTTVYLSSSAKHCSSYSSSPLGQLALSSSKSLNSPQHGPKFAERWKLYAAGQENFWISEAEEIASTDGGGGGDVFISALFFAAFVGLSVLTIGVIYLGVTDFLQKRERERFEKEEASKKKKSRKKTKVRARARSGPRGFGQKIEEDDEDEITD